MLKFKWLSLLFVGIGLAACLAEEAKEQPQEKVAPKPDLAPVEIVVPNGLKPGIGSQVKVLVDNLTKDSQVQGKVLVELVVISAQTGERLNYRTEVDAMKFKQKKEALFTEVRVPASTNTVRLLAIVDPESGVEEITKDNNRRLFQIAVTELQASPGAEKTTEDGVGDTKPGEVSPPSEEPSNAEASENETKVSEQAPEGEATESEAGEAE